MNTMNQLLRLINRQYSLNMKAVALLHNTSFHCWAKPFRELRRLFTSLEKSDSFWVFQLHLPLE
jgi:hypothetical protein